MEWQKLRIFYFVAKEKSISRAAINLNLSQSAVTRAIQLLEYQAKSTLFIRHAKGLTFTKQGEILFEHVKNMMTEIETARNEISGISDRIEGNLTITTTHAYATTVLFKYICNFKKKYPDIKIRLICDDEDLDLTKKEADVAVYATTIMISGKRQLSLPHF